MASKKRSPVSARDRFEIFKRDRFTCHYCGGKPPEVVLHLDHIHPVSKGGTNEPDNLITSCRDCNLGKSDVPLGDVRPVPSRDAIEELREQREQLEAYQAFVLEEREARAETTDMVAIEIRKALRHDPEPKEKADIARFLKMLPLDEVLDAVDVTAGHDYTGRRAWRYFCGVCWTKARARNPEIAKRQDQPAESTRRAPPAKPPPVELPAPMAESARPRPRIDGPCHLCNGEIEDLEAGQLVLWKQPVGTQIGEWVAVHDACLDQTERNPYWLPLDELMTYTGLASWHMHLSRKPWIKETDWMVWHQHFTDQMDWLYGRGS